MSAFGSFDISDLSTLLMLARHELGPVLLASGLILLLYGLANAFFGYKLFKLALMIAGFLTGGLIGAIVSFFVMQEQTSDGTLILGGLIGAVLGAVLAVALHRLGVFLIVGAAACLFFYMITELEPVAVVLGIICGVIGAILEKYAIIISTGLSGGAIAAAGLGLMVPLGHGPMVLLGLVIGVGGAAFQLWMEWRKKQLQPASMPQPAPQPAPQQAAMPRPAAVPASAPASVPAAAPVRGPVVGTPLGSGCCPNCGNVLSAEAAFCNKCGRMIQAESSGGSLVCKKCGAQIPNSANFCRKCGTSRLI